MTTANTIFTFAMHILHAYGVCDCVNEVSPAPFFGSVALCAEGNVRLVARFNASCLVEFTVCFGGNVLSTFGLDDVETALDVIEGAVDPDDREACFDAYSDGQRMVYGWAKQAFDVAVSQVALAA